jgi:hypothetical protein
MGFRELQLPDLSQGALHVAPRDHLPAHRGEEVPAGVYRLHAQKALLYLLLG